MRPARTSTVATLLPAQPWRMALSHRFRDNLVQLGWVGAYLDGFRWGGDHEPLCWPLHGFAEFSTEILQPLLEREALQLRGVAAGELQHVD